MDYLESARQFEFEETAFHLGFLPTEQSSPLTRNMDLLFTRSTEEGVRNLQSVDRNVLSMARRIVPSREFSALAQAILDTIRGGGRVVFSGCGATGRLSILLEAMWREACPEWADSVQSIMTGGDFALVKSVEAFEDYAQFGARQVRDLRMGKSDLLVAITEGGETSSVLGTVREFTRIGGHAFLLFNNPAPILREHLERSREAIDNPLVTVLDLSCGPMALAGSTRMQATTCEQLVASAALEIAANHLANSPVAIDFPSAFHALLEQLESIDIVQRMARQINAEADIYRKQGRITYFADEYMLDLFTDTTERSPTFMLPPFHRIDDSLAPEPWAFVRNPLLDTPHAIRRALGNRAPRCLSWTQEDYRQMNAPQRILNNPPRIGVADLEAIPVGNEPLPARYATENDAAVLFSHDAPSSSLLSAFQRTVSDFAGSWTIRTELPAIPRTKLKVFEHLAVKLQWNIISTGTMAKLGRISGNWMNYVAISNKKLIDRAIRLIAELAKVDYHTACIELFRSIAEGDPTLPAVQQTLKRLLPELAISN